MSLIKLTDSNTFSPLATQSHREPQKNRHFRINLNYESRVSPMAQWVKNSLAIQETQETQV